MADRDLWRARRAGKERLVAYARHRLRQSQLARGKTPSQAAWADDALDPDVLTIGFARRFATYKRATLLFRDVDRLRRLLLDAERPVQLIFAGKAHPADEPGHHLLQEVAALAAEIDLRHRLVLLEDYDISVARMLVQGCDVWLNTPLRPNEACGTSGMKVVFNGGLNCSILDGWWDEMYTPDVGWAIPSAETTGDLDARNELESAERLRDPRAPGGAALLPTRRGRPARRSGSEGQAVHGPARAPGRVDPDAARVRRGALRARGGPQRPHGVGDEFTPTRELVRWARHLDRSWPSVFVASAAHEDLGAPGGSGSSAQVSLDGLDADDVAVQVVHGEVDLDDELRRPGDLGHGGRRAGEHPGWRRFVATSAWTGAGNFGFTVRSCPRHADVADYAQLGQVAWAPPHGGHR